MRKTMSMIGVAAVSAFALVGCGPTDSEGSSGGDSQEDSGPAYEVEEDGRDLVVEFDVSEGGGSATAQDAGFRALDWAVREHPDHDGRFVLRSYRDDGESTTVNAFYEQDTIESIDFDSFDKYQLWEVRDAGAINPSYLDD